ncbi:MAG: KAP family NTPase, partial [Anaerolineae bacterium]|nr:KAP family NTPase [Anaerolineae bacterium]
GPHFRTVWFTAWKYERTEALWRAFILRVLDALYPREVDQDRPEEEWERIPLENLSEEQQRQIEHLHRLEESVYRAVEWEEDARWALDLGRLGKEAAKLPGFLLLSAAGAGGLAEALGISPDLAEAIQRRARTARLEQLISMEQFEATFQQVLRDILGSEGRLVVFVDDLDRCLPEKAVEVLEAIKLFLEVEGTVFVLGLDREVICRGIEVYYRRQGSEVPISGDDYLEKFIQIPFHLPPLDAEDLERLLEAAERSAQEPEWVDLEQYTEARRIDEAVRRILARGVGPNPRQAKRALNAFRLLQAVALAREARGTLPPETPWPILAKIVVLQTQYPEVYRHWLEPGMQDLPVHLERALETGEAPPEAPGRVQEVIQNLLQDPVRSYQLREVLTYPPAGEERTHRRRARFGDLRPDELEWYRRLATPLTLPLTVGRAGPLEEALASG